MDAAYDLNNTNYVLKSLLVVTQGKHSVASINISGFNTIILRRHFTEIGWIVT